ncbi:hypothetical protein GCM10027610_096450 [Dactylosporangium cerinum]
MADDLAAVQDADADGVAGVHIPVYAEDRRSSTSESPASSSRTGGSAERQCAVRAPAVGSRTPIEQRYGGTRSAGRSAPHRPEKISSCRRARASAGPVSDARSSAS